MKTNTILGFIMALGLSTQVLANDLADSPPFAAFICEANNISVEIEINHYRKTTGAGPAAIQSDDLAWSGGWSWKAAPKNTRLTGYYHIAVQAKGQNSQGSFYFHSVYDPYYGKLSGGWIEMPGVPGAIAECEILK